MSEQKDFEPSRLLGHKFRLASIGIDKYCRRRGGEDESQMPRGQSHLLGYILRQGEKPIYQKDLEKAFRITGATASNMLKSLEKTGYIRRIPSKEDGRLKQIVVTEKAIEREKKINNDILFLEDCMTAGFSEEEKRQIFSLMDRLISNIWDLNSREEDAAREDRNEEQS